jgi:hypothetical protein
MPHPAIAKTLRLEKPAMFTSARVILGIAALAVLTARPAHAAESVSLESLLAEMIDRGAVARVPEPHYICRQFSSYDRDTVAVDQPGWFANWDRSQFVRVETNGGRKEYVMLDAEGPGAIVRFWATWHGPRQDGKLQPFSNGTLRVYLDGQSEPAVEGPIADLLSGGGLVGPPLSNSVAPETPYERRGHNLYLPIPYGSGCKITYQSDAILDFGAQRGEALYYQINYRAYEPGTQVESFSQEQLVRLQTRIGEVSRRLLQAGPDGMDSANRSSRELKLASGSGPQVVFQGDAGGALRQISLRLQAEDLDQALRSTILSLEFDGRQTAWCPVGDFFGIGHQLPAYRRWYTRVEEDGTMSCSWVMPFEKNYALNLQNLGFQPVEVSADLTKAVDYGIVRLPWMTSRPGDSTAITRG